MTRIKKLSNNKKRKVNNLVAQAYAAYKQKNTTLCLQICQQIDSLQANNPDAANLRGIRAFYSGNLVDTEKYFTAAVAASPKRVDLRLTIAQFYSQQQNNPLALEHFQAAHQLDAKEIDAILGYGQHLSLNDQHVQAIHVIKQAKKRFPTHEIVCLALARAYFGSGDIKNAQENIDLILNNNPKNANALLAQARIFLQQGDFKKTEATCMQTLKHAPNLVDAYSILCEIKTFQDEHDPLISDLKKLRDETANNSKEFGILSIALSRVQHSLKQYEQSFKTIKNFKDIQHANIAYHNEEELAHLQGIIEVFNEDCFTVTSQSQETTPIFIVGMPRCGSTLVEQILASHPDIQSTGEHDYFALSINKNNANNPPLTIESMLQKGAQWWDAVGETYLHKLRLLHPKSPKITDKSLDNIRYIGAIHKAFPHAKIIHVERDPMDTCWSIYKNYLTANLFSYANDLTELGYYYRTYQRLMQHWHRTLPEGVMYRLSYEQLIQEQEQETEKLLSFCGMPYHEDCLKFHRANNVALTVSQVQVRKPIYQDSIQAWKHYETQLQPLSKIINR